MVSVVKIHNKIIIKSAFCSGFHCGKLVEKLQIPWDTIRRRLVSGFERQRNDLQYSAILCPRWARNPYYCIFEGLSAALYMVQQPGGALAGKGFDFLPEFV